MDEFGISENVFGTVTNNLGFITFLNDGFTLLIPSKWNPSKEKDFFSLVLWYEYDIKW